MLMQGFYVLVSDPYMCVNRRKFRSQTSDNMDRWKSTDRKNLRQGESQKREDQRGRKIEERRSREKVTALWREAHLPVKMIKTSHVRTTFGSCDVEKAHAIVARRTF